MLHEWQLTRPSGKLRGPFIKSYSKVMSGKAEVVLVASRQEQLGRGPLLELEPVQKLDRPSLLRVLRELGVLQLALHQAEPPDEGVDRFSLHADQRFEFANQSAFPEQLLLAERNLEVGQEGGDAMLGVVAAVFHLLELQSCIASQGV